MPQGSSAVRPTNGLYLFFTLLAMRYSNGFIMFTLPTNTTVVTMTSLLSRDSQFKKRGHILKFF